MTDTQVVLVTGASKETGIGFAIAERLASNGYKVYATFRSKPPLSRYKNLIFIRLDLENDTNIASAVSKILTREHRLDVLINNAGIGCIGALETQSLEDMQRQLQINFIGPLRLCQEVIPAMRKQNAGLILNISSIQGLFGAPYASIYGASKAALESAAEALAIELRPWNINVVILEPGHVSTKIDVIKGTRHLLEESLYDKPHAYMWNFQKEKTSDITKIAPDYQTPDEIAQIVQLILKTPQPSLRYQTSEAAKKLASIKLCDLSGEKLLKELAQAFD